MIAADFLDRLDGHQSAAYLDGAVETIAYCLAATGDNAKATRVLDWYYRGAALIPAHPGRDPRKAFRGGDRRALPAPA